MIRSRDNEPGQAGAARRRIPLLTAEEMTPEQRRFHDEVLSGPRGQMIGPLRAAIHSPELARRWSPLGEFLRFGTILPDRVVELAIAVTGRRWSSQIEWWVHASKALDAGVSPSAMAAIQSCEAPAFDNPLDLAVYEFTRQIHQSGQPALKVYSELEALWGPKGIVELTAVIGYYTMVAITLNTHEIPLPDGVAAGLEEPGEVRLVELAEGRLAEEGRADDQL